MNNNCDFPQMPQNPVGNVEVDKITQLEYPLHSNKTVEGGKVAPTIYGDTITKNGKELKAPTIIVSSDKPIYEKAVMFNGIKGLRKKAKEWADGYYDFLQYNTKDTPSLAINSLGLVGASFIPYDPIVSYAPPSAGTSEGQLLTIRGCLLQYKATKEAKWKTLADKLMDGLLNYYYPTPNPPATPDVGWVPHWLVNVNEPFTSREYFLDGRATFVNGVATVNYNKVFKIHSVRALDAEIKEKWTPDSEIIGTSYKIESTQVRYGESSATITLADKTVNGELLIAYSSETGPIINVGEQCEAYPVWRPMDEGEIACAVDALHWALDCFYLYLELEPNNSTKWQRAIDCTLEAIEAECDVSNTIYYIKAGDKGEPVISNGLTNYSERSPKETYTNNNGVISINYGATSTPKEASISKWVGNKVVFNRSNWIEASICTSAPTRLTLKLDEDEGYNPDKRWRCDFFTQGMGLGNSENFTFYPEDFYKEGSVRWGTQYGSDADYNGITSEHSSLTGSRKIVNGREITELVFHRGDEGGWLGWSQVVLGLFGVKLPIDIKYKTSNRINFCVKDSNEIKHFYELPTTNGEFKTITLTESMLSDSSTIGSADYGAIMLEAIDEDATIQLEYFGHLVSYPHKYLTSLTFSYREPEALKVDINYIKPAPSRSPLPYAPYMLPFDMHFINYELSNLRGAIYTGYQAPWIYQHGVWENNPVALQTNLQFLQDAQDAYHDLTGYDGFFAPIFWWDYLDDAGDNPTNTFGMAGNGGMEGNGAVVWGGFQYRTIKDVARVLIKEHNNQQAHDICIRFFQGMKKWWGQTLTEFPTVFVENHEPYNDQIDAHMVANLMEALIITQTSCSLLTESQTKLITDLIEKCVVFLYHYYVEPNGFNSAVEGTWSEDIRTWYEFWGGDILSAIAKLNLIENIYIPNYQDSTTVNNAYKVELDLDDLGENDRIYKDPTSNKWKVERYKTGVTNQLNKELQDKLNSIPTFAGNTYVYLITDKDVHPKMAGTFYKKGDDDMQCGCNDSIYTAFCGKCLPESQFIMPVDRLPELFLADREHLYLTHDNSLYLLNYERTGYIRLTTTEG